MYDGMCLLLLQIVEQPYCLPDHITEAQGMELEKSSYPRPFFALSVFDEDSVSTFYEETEKILLPM